MTITIEKWKPIVGYEQYYLVSNFGNIKSLDKKIKNRYGYRFMPSKKIKPYMNKLGYFQVRLYKNGKSKNCYIHRLVAEAFISNVNNFKEVNHIDENPSNNNVNNLEWCSRKYNVNYGNHNVKMARSKSKSVIQYDLNLNKLKEWDSLNQIQRKLKYNASNICKCCNFKRQQAYGFVWRYKYE